MAPHSDEVQIEPDHFDVIILGTGLPESMIAAAAACAGKSVLHLDHESNYGSQYASLPFHSLNEWIEIQERRSSESGDLEQSVPSSNSHEDAELSRVDPRAGQRALYGALEVQDMLGEEHRHLLGNLRSYSLDLCGPKMVYCAGGFVDALIRSGAHQYLEFKPLQATLIYRPTGLAQVPCSRAELFKDRSLSGVDKRMLMRFLQACMADVASEAPSSESSEASISPQSGRDQADAQGVLAHPQEPFIQTLQRYSLSEAVQQVVLYALALVDADQTGASERLLSEAVSAEAGVRALRMHMHSTGKYGAGQGAFLVPLYGTGELPQAFCRLAAVKGAIYVLRRQVSGIGVKPFTPTPQPSSPSPPPESANQPALSQPSPAASNQQSADRFNSSTPAQQDSAPDAAASCAERTCLPGDAALPTPQVSFKANVPAKPRRCTVQTQGGQRLGCDVLVANAAYDGSALRSTALGGGGGSNCLEGGEGGDVRARRVARCVCVTDRSLLQDKSQLLVVLPPGWTSDSPYAIRCLQVGEASNAAPVGRFVVYMSTKCVGEQHPKKTGVQLLREAVDVLFKPWKPEEASNEEADAESTADAANAKLTEPLDIKPNLMWAMYYEQFEGGQACLQTSVPGGMAVCSPPGDVVDLDTVVHDAEQTFCHLFPDHDFFPALDESEQNATNEESDMDAHEMDAMLSTMQLPKALEGETVNSTTSTSSLPSKDDRAHSM